MAIRKSCYVDRADREVQINTSRELRENCLIQQRAYTDWERKRPATAGALCLNVMEL